MSEWVLAEFHLTWMRPLWLWGLLPLLLVSVMWLRKRSSASAWESFVDPELRPYVIEKGDGSVQRGPIILFTAWALALLLMAGPVWQQREIPVFEAEQAEVIVFDVSSSMQATDLSPDRLTRARFKLQDKLRQSDGMQTGLIAFAERPYVISPLTDDARTIEAFLPSLSPEIIPAQGSRLDLAIERAVVLLQQAGVRSGQIIVFTDAKASATDVAAAAKALSAGFHVSVLAVGTAEGVPLRGSDGQFLKFSDGSIVVPQLDFRSLQTLAEQGGGIAEKLSNSNDDLLALDAVRSRVAILADSTDVAAQRIYWIEYSPWLLWVLVALLLLAFRRGVAA